MNKQIIFSCLLTVVVVLSACSRSPQFEVRGEVRGAEGQTLYLEHTGLLMTEVEDSCQLTADGQYVLHGAAPVYPDFYRLRVGSNYAVLVVDSIETITLRTTADSLPLTEGFLGSPQSVKVAELRQSLRSKTMDEHRQFAQSVILQNPRSMVAYYAVFQSKQGVPVFDIFDPQQRKYYQVVATS